MKKKLTIAVIAVAVIVGAIFAWRVAYSMRKNTDNLPALTAIAEMSEAEVNSLLPGYKINQLKTYLDLKKYALQITCNALFLFDYF